MSVEEGEAQEEEEEEQDDFTERQHRMRYTNEFHESEADRYYPASVTDSHLSVSSLGQGFLFPLTCLPFLFRLPAGVCALALSF